MKLILRVNNVEIDILVDTGSSVTVVPKAIAERFKWPVLPTPPNYKLLRLITATGEEVLTEPLYTKLKVQIGFATWWHYAWVDSRRSDKYITVGTDFLDGKNILISFSSRIMIPLAQDYYVSPFDIPNFDTVRHSEISDDRYNEPATGSVRPSLDKELGIFKSAAYRAWINNMYVSLKTGQKPPSMDHEYISSENLPSLYKDRMCVGRNNPEDYEFTPLEGCEAEPFSEMKSCIVDCKRVVTLEELDEVPDDEGVCVVFPKTENNIIVQFTSADLPAIRVHSREPEDINYAQSVQLVNSKKPEGPRPPSLPVPKEDAPPETEELVVTGILQRENKAEPTESQICELSAAEAEKELIQITKDFEEPNQAKN